MSDYEIELTGDEEARVDELCDKIRKNMESEPMTPRERFDCVARGDEPDRIPIQVCAMGLHVAAVSGITPGELYDDPKVSLMAYLAHLERFGYDTVSAFRFSEGAKEFGGEVTVAEGGIPFVTEGSVKSMEDIPKIKVPDCRKDGSLPWQLWMIEVLKDKLGDIMPVYGFIVMPGGPISCPGCRTLPEGLTDVIENPEMAHKLGDIFADFVIDYGNAQVDAGADGLYVVGVDNMVSKKVSEEFELPLMKKLAEKIRCPIWTIGADDWTHTLPGLAKTGIDGFFVFGGQPLEPAKNIARENDLILRYGLSMQTLLHGPAESVEAEVKDVIKKGWQGGKFVLGTEAMDFNTPNANLDAFMKAAKEYGKLPLKL
jgi:uroporphyrinogen-III decarboxylase